VYQQTFVDTYSKVADAKLYTEKSVITAVDMLNDRVIPFFDRQEIPLMRILMDRGTEYCGTLGNHAYELFLSIEGIDHTKTKAYMPQTNGICERFHKTMKNEFYDSALRKKVTLRWKSCKRASTPGCDITTTNVRIREKYCLDKTPMQTFNEGKHTAIDKSNQLAYHKNASDNYYLYDNSDT
jgi:transposase InsO family protein